MISTTTITFQWSGTPEEAVRRFQTMIDDLVGWLRANHSDIDAPELVEPLTEDDINIGLEEGDLPDEE
jgi:hypothetical protein